MKKKRNGNPGLEKKKKGNAALEKKKYFDAALKSRGFRFGIHQVHAEMDWEGLQEFEKWIRYVYLKDRHLDRRVKELVITAVLFTLKSPPAHIKAHISKAVQAGATKGEIADVVELAGHWGGTVVQANAIEAWRLQFAPHLPAIWEPFREK